ncbi:MAG: helix-turn-helix domain-containing protein [Lachnospiraceae bacterium]|nr:helix-turn-helix domain-containing protein [Lachnospiraceae bacterium]
MGKLILGALAGIDAEKTGANIRALRKSIGMTQEELAGILGISTTALKKWERGDTICSSVHLADLTVIFDVKPSDILCITAEDVVFMVYFHYN